MKSSIEMRSMVFAFSSVCIFVSCFCGAGFSALAGCTFFSISKRGKIGWGCMSCVPAGSEEGEPMVDQAVVGSSPSCWQIWSATVGM